MSEPITILYATMTGNSRDCAENTVKRLKQEGHTATAIDLAHYKVGDISNEKVVLLTISTWGEGEAPDDGVNFLEHVKSLSAGSLPGLEFSVLALGDTSYDNFCQCGKDFDTALEALGAKRLAPRMDCDVDFQENADAWLESVVAALAGKVAA
ncbi:MAG TPA: flavodoxin domain-containing protein [Chthoniobacterales bacterium]